MRSKNGKHLIYLVSLIILFLVLLQFWNINNSYKRFNNLNAILETQIKKNSILKVEHNRLLNNYKSNEKLILKNQLTQIFFKAEYLGLKLIDFNSSGLELNLNFNGDFHSILKFFYYLENDLSSIKIAEFKIKTNNEDLFLFIKLRDERV